MNEQQQEWLEKNFPHGFCITIQTSRNSQTCWSNPEENEGLQLHINCVIELQDIISQGLTPDVIERGSLDRWE